MLNVRLDESLEQDLAHCAKSLGISKSELVRQSVVTYLNQHRPNQPWVAGKDLFARHGSGHGRLSTEGRALIKEKLRAKHAQQNRH